MSEELLLFSVERHIARIVLNRPQAGNVIDLDMARALAAAAARCEQDATIRCVVLTGAGRMFCAGGDVRAFAAQGERAGEFLGELAAVVHAAVRSFARMPKPLLALVNGPAAGAGLSLALSADIVLASRSATFSTAYGALGLTADGGMTWLLPRLVGLRRAQDLLLTSRRVLSDEALAIGLVTRLVDDALLDSEGDIVAEALARGATRAMGAARALLAVSSSSDLDTQLDREARAIAEAGASAECREGLAAFLAKRKPDFQGV